MHAFPRLADITIPAAIRFVSCEPLVGPVDLRPWLWTARTFIDPETGFEDAAMDAGVALQWVIVGGEHGPDARPMHPTWVRDIRIDCAEAGVKFFFTRQAGNRSSPLHRKRRYRRSLSSRKVSLRPDTHAKRYSRPDQIRHRSAHPSRQTGCRQEA